MLSSDLPIQYLQNLLHETEERLRLTSLELHELKKGLDESVIVSITDMEGHIIHTNAMMAKISGYSIDEILGKSHRLFNSGYHSRAFFKELWETVMCGRVWKGEIRNKKKDGSFYWVDTTIVPFLDSDGRVYQFMSVRKDITERKLSEERMEMERASREFAGRLAAVGEMAANIAHEIRNPLGAILMRAELTKYDSNLNPEILTAIEHIEKLAHKIEKIIDGVRLMARDGSQDPLEIVSASKLIGETREMIGTKVESSGVRLIIEPIDSGILIQCRPIQISQVLLNLINNAFDAVPKTGDGWVRISVTQADLKVMVSVSDSGPGIAKDIRDKIMLPFFTTKPLGKGTGLGLSISNEILRAHGGGLRLDSASSDTTFIIELPSVTAH